MLNGFSHLRRNTCRSFAKLVTRSPRATVPRGTAMHLETARTDKVLLRSRRRTCSTWNNNPAPEHNRLALTLNISLTCLTWNKTRPGISRKRGSRDMDRRSHSFHVEHTCDTVTIVSIEISLVPRGTFDEANGISLQSVLKPPPMVPRGTKSLDFQSATAATSRRKSTAAVDWPSFRSTWNTE